ncbi:7TM diverse intracellular signaling domain-containing protein [Halopseudomonas pelagia]|uniref:7TM diverse intracellular signaling domain-containing protein n=1 Tax=Halopseudomonas pelagia TaxID=553151 RepID=UPI0003B73B16|nr:7TM diverse intracellular signaling domain-containing protein [Halopseudomonas pelagia]
MTAEAYPNGRTAIASLLLLLLLSISAHAQGAPGVLFLTGTEQHIDLQPWVEYQQTARKVTYQQLLNSKAVWTAGSNRGDMNFGYTRDAVWLKLSLSSSSSRDTLWHLHFPYSSLNRVDIYQQNHAVKTSGAIVPLHQRDLAHRDPAFSLRLAPGEQTTLYIRTQSEGSLTLTSQLWSGAAFASFSVNSTALLALYCGMLLALALYNLLLYTVLRERSYLLYVCFVLSFGLGALAFTGLGARYIWPDIGTWGGRLLPLGLCLAATIGTLFTCSFLNTRQHMPGWHRLLCALMLASLILTLASLFLPVHWVILSMSLLGMIGAPLTLICILLAVRYRVPGGRIFLTAWACMIIGVVLLSLRNFGVIPSNLVTTYAMHVGSALEMLLLSFALAARFNTLKKQKEETQANLVKTLKTHEQELELKVQERTEELQIANVRLKAMAMQDPLTGLANRSALDMHMTHVLRRSQQRHTPLAVMLIDLDGFKQINDQLGHETGDQVLRTIADRLRSIARESDFVARLGGDEFVLVAEDIGTPEQAHTLAERFLDRLSLTIDMDTQSVAVGASIGISMTRSAELDMAQMLRQADMAMYNRKRSGRGGVSFYAQEQFSNQLA